MSEILIQQHYASLHRLAFSILGDEAEADDAAQETLLRVLQNLERIPPETQMKSWLSVITINIARDHLRRRAVRQRLHNLMAWARLGSNQPASPEKTYLEGESRSQLWQAVNRLDEKHRLPVVLRYVHAMPVVEIARALETSEGTIHSRLHYAILKLQDSLGDTLQPAALDILERG